MGFYLHSMVTFLKHILNAVSSKFSLLSYCLSWRPLKGLAWLLAWLQFNSDQWSLAQIHSFSYKTLLLSFVFIPVLEHIQLLHRATVSLCLVLSCMKHTCSDSTPFSCQAWRCTLCLFFSLHFTEIFTTASQYSNYFFPYHKSQLQVPALIP